MVSASYYHLYIQNVTCIHIADQLLRHGPRSLVILTGAVTCLPSGAHHSTTSAITTPGTAIRTIRVSAVAVAAFAHHFGVFHAEAHPQIGVSTTSAITTTSPAKPEVPSTTVRKRS